MTKWSLSHECKIGLIFENQYIISHSNSAVRQKREIKGIQLEKKYWNCLYS